MKNQNAIKNNVGQEAVKGCCSEINQHNRGGTVSDMDSSSRLKSRRHTNPTDERSKQQKHTKQTQVYNRFYTLKGFQP